MSFKDDVSRFDRRQSRHKERSEPRRRPRQRSSLPEEAAGSPTPQMQQLISYLPIWQQPGYLLRRLNQVHSALFVEHFAAHGLTPVQFGLLSVLSVFDRLDQARLASALGIDRTNVADVVKRLEARGAVTRRTSATDKRLAIVELTRDGRALFDAAAPGLDRVEDQLLAALDADERSRIVGLMLRVLEANNGHARPQLKVTAAQARD